MTCTERVKYYLLKGGLYWANRTEAAQLVFKSPSALGHHLSKEGTTYMAIVNEVRHIILEAPPADTRDLCYALGFTHVSGMQRWFASEGIVMAPARRGRPPQSSCPQPRT